MHSEIKGSAFSNNRTEDESAGFGRKFCGQLWLRGQLSDGKLEEMELMRADKAYMRYSGSPSPADVVKPRSCTEKDIMMEGFIR